MTRIKTMKVARVHGVDDMRIDTVTVPAPGPRDVLIRVAATGICGSDIGYIAAGGLGGGVPLEAPLALGHEFAGEVVRVGSEVQDIHPGMRCAVNPDHGYIGSGGEGAMAPYILIRDAKIGDPIFPIPDSLSFDEAALAEPLSVAMHGINLGEAGPGSRVVVLGAGPIGLSAVVALRHRGVTDIAVVDLSDARLQRAQALGANATINPGRERLFEALGKVQGHGERYGIPYINTDIFIDAAGSARALVDVVAIAKYQAKIVVIALYKEPVPIDMWRVMANEITIVGSIADSRKAEFGECVELLAKGGQNLEPLISHRVSFNQIDDALAIAADRTESAKVMLTFAD